MMKRENMKKHTTAVAAAAIAASLMLAGCAPGSNRMNVKDSCAYLNNDTFKPTGNQQQQSDQIARHYQEVADKVAPEISQHIQKMADIMKKAAGTSLGTRTPEQTNELATLNNKIGEVCK
ncbi:hypothetical protein [Arthrobacter sp. M4]|uniref:hypothetical protein n=1 Tax=Arthrobacter sp. M4 TaxID=218160 RepID=UPI001CDCCC1C|nr:hypothetical protein [Arthrobacter sp. M4]MCA4134479.1 hypothetical protein [Arthrobacter sp. M4]